MTKRQTQVAEEIKQIVSILLQRELKDPRIGFVTVTNAQVTQDLKYARIFISVLGTAEEQKATMQALTSGRGFIRREIASRMEIRAVPEIQFRLDKGMEYSTQINDLLNEIRVSDAERVVGEYGDGTGENAAGNVEDIGSTEEQASTGEKGESPNEQH